MEMNTIVMAIFFGVLAVAYFMRRRSRLNSTEE
jgi:hypothetical protein